jgi:uncharacterized membrane protein
MSFYFVLKYLHVMGGAVLLGTGIGIAFFMLMAHRRGDAKTIAEVARIVVIADFIFTATAVVAQPTTGVLLAHVVGYSLWEGWIALSIVLYIVTGMFWLPVVWMQMRMRDLAQKAVLDGVPLPLRYRRLFCCWFAFGFPAFGAVLAIFWLMIAKPAIGILNPVQQIGPESHVVGWAKARARLCRAAPCPRGPTAQHVGTARAPCGAPRLCPPYGSCRSRRRYDRLNEL